MQLTSYTDYALRVLIYLATHKGEPVTIRHIADIYGVSKNHLVKIVHQLSQLGYVETKRGRSGGLVLAQPPEKIGLGNVVRHTEDNFKIVECFDSGKGKCLIAPACGLRHVLVDAHKAFMNELDQHTLACITQNQKELSKLFSCDYKK